MGTRILATLAAAALAATGAAGCAPSPNEARPPELTVSAAASLALPLDELQAMYEERAPETKVLINYGSTGGLQKQIEMGLPADLFLGAGRKPMEQLLEQGWIDPELNDTLLTNRLVVVVPSDRTSSLHGLEELADDAWDKLAIGVPETVPAGGYAKEALEAVGIWDKAFVKAAFGKDVRQVLASVETGNADAGFVYATDAMSSGKVRVAFEVPPERHSPIVYPIGVVATTENPEEAEAFYNFLRSDEAMAVFAEYGFGPGARAP
ncbi:molybdate ABC transporter substrate-binding protein [Paenibacillus sp.]|uniref:molybdate ABC transporter substrate-binding protein n=1 Tax=Paenibacillus sp. TaxID=58172 RepID=UPI00281235FB|nr:molybdate ABC transporter substrate-binding protein [Paenibacillus sp.]